MIQVFPNILLSGLDWTFHLFFIIFLFPLVLFVKNGSGVSSQHQDQWDHQQSDESFLILLLSPDHESFPFPFPFFEANPPNFNTQQPAAAAAAADHHCIHNNIKETSTNTLNEQQEESPKVETNGNESMYQQSAHTNTNIINMGQEPHTLSLCSITSKPKPIHTFPKRSSIYRGLSRHRYTGRYEAHLWDGNSTTTTTTNQGRQPPRPRKGRQVYLGGYEMEENAARAYDLAALKYWGTTTTTNFPLSDYSEELGEMKLMTKQEHIASIRRKSSGFSRGVSIYLGVTSMEDGKQGLEESHGIKTFTWEPSLETQEEAAEAYDIAAIKFRGLNAVTNFEINRYDVKSIMENTTLPIRGGPAKCLKDAENTKMALHEHTNVGSSKHGCPAIAFQAQPLSIYPYAHQTVWSKQVQDSDVGDGSNDAHQLQLGSNQDDDHMISVAGEQSSDLSSSVGSFIVTPPMMGNDDKALVYEGLYGSTDADYKATNLCYQSPWDGPAEDSMELA